MPGPGTMPPMPPGWGSEMRLPGPLSKLCQLASAGRSCLGLPLVRDPVGKAVHPRGPSLSETGVDWLLSLAAHVRGSAWPKEGTEAPGLSRACGSWVQRDPCKQQQKAL